METHREGFIRAICEDPENDSLRLAFADYLEESGESEYSEFIRVQCELASMTPCPTCSGCGLHRYKDFADGVANFSDSLPCFRCEGKGWRDPERLYTLRRRELKLLAGTAGNLRRWKWVGGADAPLNNNRIQYKFRRGFVEKIACTAADFERHGDEICRCQPVREVNITDPAQASYGWKFGRWGGAKFRFASPNPQLEDNDVRNNFVAGYSACELEFIQNESNLDHEFRNPFFGGTEEYRGYDEAFYNFTQK